MVSQRNHIVAMFALGVVVLAGCPANEESNTGTTATSVPKVDMASGPDSSSMRDQGTAADVGSDAGPVEMGPAARPYPPLSEAPANAGPGGPAATFTSDQLFQNCAFLDGGERDVDHHNLVVMTDGYLLMPWAPEFGRGGLNFYDITDPCNPKLAGTGYSQTMRESHSIGLYYPEGGGGWAVVASLQLLNRGGIQFWDISDPSAPEAVIDHYLQGHLYPDAYKRVVLSVFWQAPVVYAAGSLNGIYIVDASNPREPKDAGRYIFDPVFQAGQVQAVGNMLIVTAAEGSRTVLLDIGDPLDPQPMPGGDFDIVDSENRRQESYFSNIHGSRLFYAVKSNGGGMIVYDIADPGSPQYAGEVRSGGNGGYVFVKDDHAFVGESSFAAIYDVSSMDSITELARLDLKGDLDTMTPIGNVAVLSVDDKANDGEGSAVAPWREEPDTKPPEVNWMYPADGSENLPVTSRFGMVFTEMIDPKSAWVSSVRLYRADQEPQFGRVDVDLTVQENILNVSPRQALEPGVRYTLELVAEGLADYSGNRLAETMTYSFTTLAP